jgi:hypothetical protein
MGEREALSHRDRPPAPFIRESGMDNSTLQEKLQRYKAFWTNAPTGRPLIGFSLGGWFPLQSYAALGKFLGRKEIAANELHPEDFLADYDRLVASWNGVEDDIIRAVAPLPPFPWLEAMLGARVQVGDEAIWTPEGGFEYADLDALDLSSDNPWRRKYLEFVAALNDRFRGRCPVGQPILRGVSDMIAALRGSSQMIFDLYDHPEQFRRLAGHCSDLLVALVAEQQSITGPFAGGYEVEQLALWAPGRIIRLQEDGSAFFSPSLYVQHLRGEDERQASSFPYSVIHLHSSSLFLLDEIFNVESLKCIQINKDVGGLEVSGMLPFFKKVQQRGRRLLIRGKLDHGDLALLKGELSPNGLYLQIVVENPAETKWFREFFQPWDHAIS